MNNAARLRIALLDIEPEPWRRIEVPLSMTLKGLHDCIQAAFLWDNSHLWEFEIGDRSFGIPFDGGFSLGGDAGDEPADAKKARLKDLLTTVGQEFLYVYDMGDDWAHVIVVEALFEAPAEPLLPRYCDGEWAAPPDDCGGAPGFANFCDAMASPDHPDHEELMDWYGGPFDVTSVQQARVHAAFKKLARPRRRTKS